MMSSQETSVKRTHLPLLRKKKAISINSVKKSTRHEIDKLLKKKEDCIIPLLVRKIYAAEDKLQFLQQQLHEAFKISKKMDEERTEIVAKSLPNRSPPTSTGFLETLKDIVNSQVVKQITSDEEITDSMILKYMEKQLKKADKEKKPAKACIKDNDRKKICITEIETENGTSQIHICQKEPEESDEIFHEIMSNESVGGTKKKYNIIKEALIARRKSNNAEFVSIMTAIREKDLTDEEKYNINQRLAVLAEEYKQLTTRMLHLEKCLEDFGLTQIENDKDMSASEEGEKTYSECMLYSPNFDNIIMAIQQLNSTIGEYRIVYTVQGAKYEKNDFLALTLYENGMALDDLSFREYSSLSAREFFYDLGDGYYPTELKSQYPDGVIFKVIDQRKEIYHGSAHKLEIFGGIGYSLGGNKHLWNMHDSFATDICNIKHPAVQFSKNQQYISKFNQYHGRQDMKGGDPTRHSCTLAQQFNENISTIQSETNGDGTIGAGENISEYQDLNSNPKPFSKHYAGGEHLKRKITYDIRKSDSVLEDELVDYSLSNAKVQYTKSFLNDENPITALKSSFNNSKKLCTKYISFHDQRIDFKHSFSISSSEYLNESESKTPEIIQLNKKLSSSQIALKIRSHDGNCIFLVYLHPEETIKKLRSLLKLETLWRLILPRRHNSSLFELNHYSNSLKEYGIVKNSVITIVH